MRQIVLCCLSLFFPLAFAQDQAAQAVKGQIVLGGDLAQWEAFPRYEVVLSNSAEPVPVSYGGYYSVAWDEGTLYFLGVFDQPKETLSIGLPADAPEWWLADTFEVFFRLEPGAKMLHVAASPDGTRFNEFLDSSNYETFSQLEDDRWFIELAFPLGKLLPAVQEGTIWELKVGRGYHQLQEYSLWPAGRDFLAEDNFGKLYFTETLLEPDELRVRLK